MSPKSQQDEALADALAEVHHLDRIQHLVEHPHRTLKWLEEALQSAVSVEFSTIPPYLCALWSIKDERHEVAASIRNVVQEEMLHMALACNMLTALGCVPRINDPNMVPRYPGPIPGHVHPELKKVSLSRLSDESLDAFIAIERRTAAGEPPQEPKEGEVEVFKTIGAFYGAILGAFQHHFKELDPLPTDRQIAGPLAYMVMENRASVEAAIALILSQGEGSEASPEVEHTHELAHYYRFLEVRQCKKLRFDEARQPVLRIDDAGEPVFDGAPLERPEVYPMAVVPEGGYLKENVRDEKAWKLINGFDQKFTRLLNRLQTVWEYGDQGALVHAIETMFGLSETARALMEIEIRPGCGNYGPCFRYLRLGAERADS